MTHAWESVIPPLDPFYISMEMYRAIRKVRPYPQVNWGLFEDRHDIRMVRSDRDGKLIVRIQEDTPAANAIREAMDTAAAFMAAEDF